MAPARFATIDIGTNSVLLLVAEQREGRFEAIVERAEITRLGRGVDRTHALAPDAIEDTLKCLESFVGQARELGVQGIAVSATSAARDASNGAELLEAALDRTGVPVEIISGEEEAELSFAAAFGDFGVDQAGRPLLVLDIGGGSTELIYGGEGDRAAQVRIRRSFDVGSVRMTERHVTSHPIPISEREAVRKDVREMFSAMPPAPPQAKLIGVAGTVTTLYAVLHGVEPYRGSQVHGQVLRRGELAQLTEGLCDLPLEKRKALPGLQPKRADVICAGALILEAAMDQLAIPSCTVSDRGVRWGLLSRRFKDR